MLDLWSKNGYNKQVSCCGLMVKRLRHRPFTAESGVRFPLRLPKKLREEISSLFLLLYLLKGIEPSFVRAPENRKIFGMRLPYEFQIKMLTCLVSIFDSIEFNF